MEKSLVIFLHSSRYDRIYQAINLELTASSMGWRCYLFLFFEALASFMEGAWNEVNLVSANDAPISGSPENDSERARLKKLQKGFELSNFPSLYEMFASARKAEGGLTVCACSTSVKLLSLEPKEVKAKIDEIVGLPTMIQIASKASHVLYI